MVEVLILTVGILVGVAPALLGVPREQGDYDFATPFIQLSWLVGCVALAIGLVVGRIV
jgi:hypothetical protein